MSSNGKRNQEESNAWMREAEAFMAKHKISQHQFGKRFMGNNNGWDAMLSGRVLRPDTVAKYRSRMADYNGTC